LKKKRNEVPKTRLAAVGLSFESELVLIFLRESELLSKTASLSRRFLSTLDDD
jgi:hypothetical protein